MPGVRDEPAPVSARSRSVGPFRRQLFAQLAVAGCQGTDKAGQGLRVQAGRGGLLVRRQPGQRHVAG